MVRSGEEPAAVEVNVASKQQSNGTRQRRRQYTTEQRKAVVKDALRVGVVAAAEQHGVPQSCVSRWSSEARLGKAALQGRRPQKAKGGRPGGARRAAAVVARSAKPQREAPPEPEAAPVARPRAARAYTPSQRARVVEFAAREGVTAASKEYGPSRYTIYQWQRKVAKAATGEGESPTSGPAESEIETQRDREILNEWHRHPGLGPSQIKNQLRRQGVKVSVHTARRVMEEAGYRPPKVKRQPHDERYESVRPNHCWHLDFVHRHINRANTFTLILIDDYSRFVVGHGVEDAERADLVISTFEEAVRRHGRPEMVMNDKGSAFWSWRGISRFTALLTEMGIDQIAAEHKEWNGKVEVFNANLAKEFFNTKRYYDVAEMRRRLAAHLSWYNEARTHHALGGLLVPADRYYGRVEQVLARIEAGAGRDPADGVELRDRCLELFKVTSRAGVPEVWLLGQRLLGAPGPGADRAAATRPSSAS